MVARRTHNNGFQRRDAFLGELQSQCQRGKLDLDYLTRWASDLGLGDLLEKASEEAGNRS